MVAAGNEGPPLAVGKLVFPLCASPTDPRAAGGPRTSVWGMKGGGGVIRSHRPPAVFPEE